jgi:ubiquinone/menaquinone biosynthesis C-methylase UbiE
VKSVRNMDEIRKNHNDAKRTLIQSVTKEGQHILDVGCGFGGDLQKWHKCGVNINMCDPEPEALVEARTRAKTMKLRRELNPEGISWVLSQIPKKSSSKHHITMTLETFLNSKNTGMVDLVKSYL